MNRKKFLINGVVQGVGFRPFVYQLALKYKLRGYVLNNSQGVEIDIQGEELEEFEYDLVHSLPPLAHIDTIDSTLLPLTNYTIFEIKESNTKESKTTLVSPDISICDDCLEDLEHSEKYKDYFATNCTNCGPRYSILKALPYDRANTSMSKFHMCSSCQEEYTNPLKRRYHAQPISCPECGPKLNITIEEAIKKIQEGKIGAIKGLGGYHLVCDSTNDDAIAKLRQRKRRAQKPFAIMTGIEYNLSKIAQLSEDELQLLHSKERPIVILKKSDDFALSQLIAPHIEKIGVMLPYTPLQYLLFKKLNVPLIATSANLSDEPIITNIQELEDKLSDVYDFVLDFNRDIINGVDDSLTQIINGTKQTLRLGRGYAPKSIHLPVKSSKNILALGANQKSSITLIFEDHMVVSPHIGDLGSIEANGYFERTIETFKRLYDFKPDVIVCDKHPEYESTKWAREYANLHENIELLEVQHHYAHILSVMAERNIKDQKVLGFSFDGTGLGDDGTLWGGEVFICDQISYERKYHFKEFRLLGGEKAVREPKRVALSILFEKFSLEQILALEIPTTKVFTQAQIRQLHTMWSKGINAPHSSSVGRLFDAVASFEGLLQTVSYEGESGLVIEHNYLIGNEDIFEYKIENEIIEIDIDFRATYLPNRLINTLVQIIVEIAILEKLPVVLSGGVFQNSTLLNLIIKNLEKKGLEYFIGGDIPPNDGGISVGQAYFALNNKNQSS